MICLKNIIVETKYLTALFLVFFNQLVFSQYKVTSEFIAKYDVTFLKDTTDVYSAKSEQMILLIGKNESLYKSANKEQVQKEKQEILQRSVAASKNTNTMTVDFSRIPKVNIVHEVLKKNDSVFVFDNILNHSFCYQLNKVVKWNILNESKNINGYSCVKAVTKYNGRNYTAWFTKELPFPEGPYNFKGLPGLIVSLEDEKKYYSFELRYFAKESINSAFPSGKKITYSEFTKMRNDAKNNIIGNLKNILHKEAMTKEEEELIKKNANRKNNYLD